MSALWTLNPGQGPDVSGCVATIVPMGWTMQRADGGRGFAPEFPLPRYPGNADEAQAAGDMAVAQHAPLVGVRDAVAGRTRAAAGSTSGILVAPMLATGQVTQAKAGSLAAASLLAGGVMRGFAAAIRTHDRTIDELNAEYQAARSSGFGIGADAGYEDGMSPTEAADARQSLIGAADRALRAMLGVRARRARAELDDAARTFATQLDIGPTEQTMRSLALAGHIDTEQAMPHLGYDGLEGRPNPIVQHLRDSFVPPDDANAWMLGGWTFGRGLAGLGAAADVYAYGKYGQFRPSIGKHAHHTLRVKAERVWRPSQWMAQPQSRGARRTWLTRGKWAARGGGVVSGGFSAYDQWQRDSADPSLDTGEKVARSTVRGGFTAAGAIGGAKVGAATGAAIGSILPGPGTAIGAAAGGIIGAAVGAGVGDAVGSAINDYGGKVLDSVGDGVKKLKFW